MSEEQNTQPTDNPEVGAPTPEEEPKFTDAQQEMIDAMIAKKIAKERSKADQRLADQAANFKQEKADAIKQAAERAKMTAEERAKAEAEDALKQLAADRAAVVQQQRELATKSMLLDKGIGSDMLPLIMGKDNDATAANLDLLNQYVDKKVQEATDKLLQGRKAPASSTAGANTDTFSGGNPWAKETFNLTQQQQILVSDPDKARQMIAAAHPTGYFVGQ